MKILFFYIPRCRALTTMQNKTKKLQAFWNICTKLWNVPKILSLDKNDFKGLLQFRAQEIPSCEQVKKSSLFLTFSTFLYFSTVFNIFWHMSTFYENLWPSKNVEKSTPHWVMSTPSLGDLFKYRIQGFLLILPLLCCCFLEWWSSFFPTTDFA